MLGICQVEKCIFDDATNYEFESIKEIVLFTIDVWDDKEISINAVQQKWTAKDCKDLLRSDIVYEPGIVAAWIEKRKDNEPLIHLMSEDDGHLFWSKNKDVCFSSCWLDNYMSVLTKTKSYILKHNKKFNIKK